MAKVTVNPGICGLKSDISVSTEDMQTAEIKIESQCPHIKQMEGDLENIDCMQECFSKFDTSKVYEAATNNCRHIACPVPSAIIKALEVTCGFALPKDVEIKIEK